MKQGAAMILTCNPHDNYVIVKEAVARKGVQFPKIPTIKKNWRIKISFSVARLRNFSLEHC